MAMQIRNEVLARMYVVLLVVVVAAIAIVARTIQIGIGERDRWREEGKKERVRLREIEAERGNILAADGSLLATSLPFFDIAFDPNSTAMSKADFEANIDSLAWCLATWVDPSYTPGGYREYLIRKREEGARYVPIKQGVTFAEMQRIRQFPLFRLGRFRGGLIVEQRYKRQRPFGLLAHRTIGYMREGAKPVGLEGAFDEVLRGKGGKQYMIRLPEGVWMPLGDLAEVEPKSGNDLLTTIDINIQDITEEALYKAMVRHEASFGVAVVMEVETGAIRAIANLSRTRKGEIWETYNHAIGTRVEPGSTFKLAAMMAMLEDGCVDLTDSIDIEKGRLELFEEKLEVKDAVAHSYDTVTVERAFQISSNVGMAKMALACYGQPGAAARFVKRLKQFNLHLPTGIEIEGEANPYIKDPGNPEDDWSGATLPWMSMGYELLLTPLQLLSFYNAVANDGKMMKPYLVEEIQRYGQTIEHFPPVVLKRKIASTETIRKAQRLLRGVVEHGTASEWNTPHYAFAGKTGTTQLDYRRLDDRTEVGGYQASFVGYFPAEAPRYSCIVLISHPRKGGIYGSQVALPVFREIADKIYFTSLDLHEPLNGKPRPRLAARKLPDYEIGARQEMKSLLEQLHMPYKELTRSDWVVVRTSNTDTLQLLKRRIPEEKVVPNVVGMTLRDALYILENRGLEVEVTGFGKVVRQSLKPGTKVTGQTIKLTLK